MNKTPEKKNRGRPKTLDRQHTIETAMACYWREGVDVFSVNKICHYAQISKPGLYREFGGEDGLMEAVLNHYREVMVKPLLAMLETDRPFAEVLRDLVVWMTEQHETPPGCLFAKMRTSPTRLGPATSTQVEALRDEMRRAYKAWYEQALARNEVSTAISPELAAYYLDIQLTNILIQVAIGEPLHLIREQGLLAFENLLVNRHINSLT